MKDLGKYAERLRYYEEHFGINRYLIEEVAIYIQDDTTKKIGSFVKKLGDFIVKDKSEISGLYKDSFITVDIKQLKKYAKDFVDYVSTLKYVTFDTVITKTDNGDSMGSLCEAYSGIYEIAIPKSRVRLKGLGEMDADELWETTMNPEKRNIMIAQVDDNDTVNSTMEDMLNSNATDKRKAFLFKNQEKAKHLNI
jgi:DNA gyrase/topoisomerase IV subunit B